MMVRKLHTAQELILGCAWPVNIFQLYRMYAVRLKMTAKKTSRLEVISFDSNVKGFYGLKNLLVVNMF